MAKKKKKRPSPAGVEQRAQTYMQQARQDAMLQQERKRQAYEQKVNANLSRAAENGTDIFHKSIDETAVREAFHTLQKYKTGKNNLEQKIIRNEQWWKLRHWDYINTGDRTELEPSSAWLFNALASKHADAMDNIPAPVILPREEADVNEAEMLSSVIPVIHKENDFESVYDDVWWYKLKHGCGVYKIVWSNDKLNGLGDIDIRKADLLNLFWEPGITDIQKSKNLFSVELWDNKDLENMYPQLQDKLGGENGTVAKYVYDDTVDTTNKSLVVDWYYKKRARSGKTILHYCKFVNDTVLFATENEPDKFPDGFYDHGRYPFVFDVLFPIEGSPCGFGYIDVCKNPQAYIDLLGRSILRNAVVNSTPRYFVRNDCGLNEDEFLDVTAPIIHVDGNMSDDTIRPATGSNLADVYVTFHNEKIDELKETSGNRDVSNGGTGGATAASAIAAMQEAGSKLSRDMIKASYRKFSEIIKLEVELIRQFYDIPRAFRIIGENGARKFVQYGNEGLKLQSQGMDFGIDQGYRLPEFDIEINAQKSNPYSRVSQNEMALQFYQLGFFNPQLSDQALACLDMMDFDRKDSVKQRIAENGTMAQMLAQQQQQIAQLSAIVDQITGSNLSGAAAPEEEQLQPQTNGKPVQRAEEDRIGSNNTGNNIVDKTKQRVAEGTSPM